MAKVMEKLISTKLNVKNEQKKIIKSLVLMK